MASNARRECRFSFFLPPSLEAIVTQVLSSFGYGVSRALARAGTGRSGRQKGPAPRADVRTTTHPRRKTAVNK